MLDMPGWPPRRPGFVHVGQVATTTPGVVATGCCKEPRDMPRTPTRLAEVTNLPDQQTICHRKCESTEMRLLREFAAKDELAKLARCRRTDRQTPLLEKA